MREKQKNAIYLRLSVEDDAAGAENRHMQEESNSISNQRKMLMEYISREAELTARETAEFCEM